MRDIVGPAAGGHGRSCAAPAQESIRRPLGVGEISQQVTKITSIAMI